MRFRVIDLAESRLMQRSVTRKSVPGQLQDWFTSRFYARPDVFFLFLHFYTLSEHKELLVLQWRFIIIVTIFFP